MGESDDVEKQIQRRPADNIHSDGSSSELSIRALARPVSIPGSDAERKREEEKPPGFPEKDIPHSPNQPPEISTSRPRSRASTSRSRAIVLVPSSRRRGLFGRFTVIPEVEQPYDYSRKTKWTITLIVALAAAGGPLGSSIFYPVLPQMAIDLHATTTVTNLSVAFYMLAMAIVPLWWSSFSELYGRRTIYISSFSLFVVFSVASARSTDVTMLIVFRLLGGGASASVQAVGAGTIADIWETHERGTAMGIFYLGPLMGPLLAPIIGGALGQAFGWASTMWCLAIYGGIILVMLFFFLPETLAKVQKKQQIGSGNPPGDEQLTQQPRGSTGSTAGTLTRSKTTESVQVHTKRVAKLLMQVFVDPLRVLLYLRFPPVAITVYFASITFGCLFALNISVQDAYSNPPYDFDQLIVGLLYIPSAVGYIVASVLGGRWIDRIMAREARKAGRYDANGKLIYLPEDRMRENAWVAGTVYPASLIFWGWTINATLYWLVPALGLFSFGAGSMLVFSAAATMLTEFMPRRSSSGIAVNNFVRNIFSCVGAIVAQPIISAIGNGWLFTILGLIAWITGYLCTWALNRYGPRWRQSMDAALNK